MFFHLPPPSVMLILSEVRECYRSIKISTVHHVHMHMCLYEQRRSLIKCKTEKKTAG